MEQCPGRCGRFETSGEIGQISILRVMEANFLTIGEGSYGHGEGLSR